MSAPAYSAAAMRPYLPARAGFESGTDSPRAFLERCLAAIEAREGEIGAFVSLNIEGARAVADRASERWRSGQPLSSIDGMPLGIKDIIETIDMPTGMGSPMFDGWQSHRDAASVAALREAGAVILGKTVTTEFAATVPRGTRNPHDPARTPGGSSSGSAAAVAAGFVSAALGTQVIGSVIRPASYCGCVGFKASVGALNRGGSHDTLSQSATGVLAATLDDAWQVAIEIARRAGGDPGCAGLSGPDTVPQPDKPIRLAVLQPDGWMDAPAEVREQFDRALARIAETGIELRTRDNDRAVADAHQALVDAVPQSRRINAWESRWPLNTYRDRDKGKLSEVMLARVAEAEAMSIDDYRALLTRRSGIRARYALLARICDACVTLSASGPAPLGLESTGDPAFAVPSSLLGVPALSLPLLSVDGLPLGLQVIGFADQDASLFAAASWLNDHLSAGQVPMQAAAQS